MYYIGSVIAGVLISVMIFANGEVSTHYGLYAGTAIIHFIGLVAATAILFVKKESLKVKEKVPMIAYTGGIFGFITIICNNFAFGKISISAILALGLLGQSLTSLIFDEIGVLGMPVKKFKPSKIIGILLVAIGIVIMIWREDGASVVPIVASILTGFTIVFSRTVNAKLASASSAISSTWYNYAFGLLMGIIFVFILGRGEPALNGVKISLNPLIYTGGLIGYTCVLFLNYAVSKISSFYMTLALFVGQVFMGVIIDIVMLGMFSFEIMMGGIFVALGLCLDLIIDRNEQNKQAQS
jgi:bacterial/archaeal transporter family-2 protein